MNGIDSPSESSDDQDQDVEQDHKPKIKKRRNIGNSQNSFQKMIVLTNPLQFIRKQGGFDLLKMPKKLQEGNLATG